MPAKALSLPDWQPKQAFLSSNSTPSTSSPTGKAAMNMNPKEFRRLIREATAGDAWIVAGNYTKFSHELTWPRADTIIWLDLPLPLLSLRLLRQILAALAHAGTALGHQSRTASGPSSASGTPVPFSIGFGKITVAIANFFSKRKPIPVGNTCASSISPRSRKPLNSRSKPKTLSFFPQIAYPSLP